MTGDSLVKLLVRRREPVTITSWAVPAPGKPELALPIPGVGEATELEPVICAFTGVAVSNATTATEPVRLRRKYVNEEPVIVRVIS